MRTCTHLREAEAGRVEGLKRKEEVERSRRREQADLETEIDTLQQALEAQMRLAERERERAREVLTSQVCAWFALVCLLLEDMWKRCVPGTCQ